MLMKPLSMAQTRQGFGVVKAFRRRTGRYHTPFTSLLASFLLVVSSCWDPSLVLLLLQVALSPPVSRDNVALACVAGALGRLKGTNFDGADEINAAASQA